MDVVLYKFIEIYECQYLPTVRILNTLASCLLCHLQHYKELEENFLTV